MGCRNDYTPPNRQQAYSKLTCECIVYALTKLERKIPTWIAQAAKAEYGNADRCEEATIKLCDLLKGLPLDTFNDIVYDRTKEARALANWWDEHQEEDRKREEREAEKKRQRQLVKSAKAMLTDEEWKAVLEYAKQR